jgi:hypothetical protein
MRAFPSGSTRQTILIRLWTIPRCADWRQGEIYSVAIPEHIRNAGCVVVVWSSRAIASNDVLSAADRAFGHDPEIVRSAVRTSARRSSAGAILIALRRSR